MARLRYNGVYADVSGTKTVLKLGAALTNSATSVTLNGALKHSGGTAVQTIASPDYLPVTVLDANGIVVDAFNITAYTAGATTATVTRSAQGFTAIAHASGATLVHSATAADLASVPVYVKYATMIGLDSTGSWVNVSAANLSITFVVPASGVVKLTMTAKLYQGINGYMWRVHDGTAGVAGSEQLAGGGIGSSGSSGDNRPVYVAIIDGLTPGATLTWKWQHMGGTARFDGSPALMIVE